MKKLLLLLVFIFALSCTKEESKNCDADLQELKEMQQQGWEHCNGNIPCISKINQDYEKRKQEILNNCN